MEPEGLTEYDKVYLKERQDTRISETAKAIMLSAMQREHFTSAKKPGVLTGDKLAAKAREWALVLHGQPPSKDKQE